MIDESQCPRCAMFLDECECGFVRNGLCSSSEEDKEIVEIEDN